MKVAIHFPREFNGLSLGAQKRGFARDFSTAVGGVIERLTGRDLDYDFSQMERDFKSVLAGWVKKTPASRSQEPLRADLQHEGAGRNACSGCEKRASEEAIEQIEAARLKAKPTRSELTLVERR